MLSTSFTNSCFVGDLWMKCAYPGCNNSSMEHSNYCKDHRKARMGDPLSRVAISIDKFKAGVLRSADKLDGKACARAKIKSPPEKK